MTRTSQTIAKAKKSLSAEQGESQDDDFSRQEELEVDEDPNANDDHTNFHDNRSEEDNDSSDVERHEKKAATLAPRRKTRQSGKNRGRPKSKVGKGTEESEESSEDEDVDVSRKKLLTKLAVPSIRSRATDSLASARISINRIDLLRPPLPIRFGQWNDRLLVGRHAKVLQNSFQTQGVRSFEMENMIPLVIRKDHIDSKCLNFGVLNPAEAPILQLTPEGLKASSIKAAGGRHRFRAVELETDRLSTEIKRLEGKIQSDDTATEEETDMNRAYRATIETLSKEKERVCMWGVIIYDEGKQSISISRGENLKSKSLRASFGGGRDARNRAIAE